MCNSAGFNLNGSGNQECEKSKVAVPSITNSYVAAPVSDNETIAKQVGLSEKFT
ncbi:unannotated protein [freshwater metagenome]|uniref:Unannotated protein n=1 Tax=freshwater metagenome TaxID=449393 RepID=A0A6J6EL17_9ZZZZ